jgi:hypothetical protein
MENKAEEYRRKVREDVRKMSGIKAGEMGMCILCGKSPLATMQFYRIGIIDTYFVNPEGIQQIGGLAMHFGGGQVGLGLSMIMGSDPDVGKRVAGTSKPTFICGDCALKPHNHLILNLVERATEEEEHADKGEA